MNSLTGLLRHAVGGTDAAKGGIVSATLSSAWLWLAGAIVTFVVGVFMARQLGPDGYGVYGTTLAIVALLGVPAQASLPLLATREFAAATARNDRPMLHGLLRWFTGSVLALSVATGLGLVAVTAIADGLLPALRPALMLGAALVPGFALCALFAGMIRGQGRIVAGQAVDVVVRPGLFCLGLIILRFAGTALSVNLAIVLQAITALGAALAGFMVVLGGMPARDVLGPRARQLRRWLASAMPMTLTEGMRQLDGAYGVLLISLLATTGDAGLYRVALSSLVLISMPISVLNIVTAPYLARYFAAGDMAAVQRVVTGAALAMTAAVGAMTMGFALLGHWAIGTAFGAAYLPAYLPLLILCGAQLASACSGVGVTLLSMAHRERILSRVFSISVIVAIGLAALLIPRAGATGAALAMLCGMVLRGVLVNREARRSIGIRPSVLSLVPLGR